MTDYRPSRKSRCILAFVVSLMFAPACSTASCLPSDTVVCILDSRFAAEVEWTDPSDLSVHSAHMVPILGDNQAYAWFLDESEVELFFKMIDGRVVNDHFWAFAASLTDREYTLRITDSASGAQREFHNPSGRLLVFSDVEAFSDVLGALRSSPSSQSPLGKQSNANLIEESLLLVGGRFRISITFLDPRTGGPNQGRPTALSDRSGMFWFFSPADADLMVKVVDNRSKDGSFWFYSGTLAETTVNIAVTDLITGVGQLYTLEGPFGFVDRRRFPSFFGGIFANDFEFGDLSGWFKSVP